MNSTTVDPTLLPTDNRAAVVIGAVIGCSIVNVIIVSLRFYTRHWVLGQVGADDWLALVSLMCALATGVSMCLNTTNGLGHHIWTIVPPLGPADGMKQYLKNFFVSIAFYNTGLLFVKMTFLAQYYRVLTLKKMRNVTIVTMVLVGCWSLSQVLIGIFICTPIAGFWDQTIPHTCIPVPLQWYINAAGNIVSDIVVFILPLPVLKDLKLPNTQKRVLIGIFCLGFFTCAISVIRIQYLRFAEDPTFDNTAASGWSIGELSCGLVCSCLPTLRPLVAKWTPAFKTVVSRSNHGYSSRGYSRTGVTNSMNSRKDHMSHNVESQSLGGSEHELVSGKARFASQPNPSSLDQSEKSLGLKSSRSNMLNELASPMPAALSPPSGRREKEEWFQPSVTTQVGADVSRPGSSRRVGSSGIRVQTEFVVEECDQHPEKSPSRIV